MPALDGDAQEAAEGRSAEPSRAIDLLKDLFESDDLFTRRAIGGFEFAERVGYVRDDRRVGHGRGMIHFVKAARDRRHKAFIRDAVIESSTLSRLTQRADARIPSMHGVLIARPNAGVGEVSIDDAGSTVSVVA